MEIKAGQVWESKLWKFILISVNKNDVDLIAFNKSTSNKETSNPYLSVLLDEIEKKKLKLLGESKVNINDLFEIKEIKNDNMEK